ncbi:UvrD-helicase domain-containing protein, partial [Patescibacteria group bacterium]|nr:UvrD-helicase domain-containing protein [Patescibacteria group bacterium]
MEQVRVRARGEATFKRHYEQLNAQQRAAVDVLEGPVMVLAGPGTDKTHLLAVRVANILRST